jgi:hypothetical protein
VSLVNVPNDSFTSSPGSELPHESVIFQDVIEKKPTRVVTPKCWLADWSVGLPLNVVVVGWFINTVKGADVFPLYVTVTVTSKTQPALGEVAVAVTVVQVEQLRDTEPPPVAEFTTVHVGEPVFPLGLAVQLA